MLATDDDGDDMKQQKFIYSHIFQIIFLIVALTNFAMLNSSETEKSPIKQLELNFSALEIFLKITKFNLHTFSC